MNVHVTNGKDFNNVWHHLHYLTCYGEEHKPRGFPIREAMFVQTYITCPFDWHVERELNLDYLRREFQWYLNGDNEDLRICEHGHLWEKSVNRDLTLCSNYGYYLFTRGGLLKAVQSIRNDPDTRQAVVSIFNQFQHIKPGINDVPCTCSITFMLRNKKLHMGVHMRSNDLVYGLGNDAPCFHWIHSLAYWLLKEDYEDIQMGGYVHRADSLHVYERHYELNRTIGNGKGTWEPEKIPEIASTREARALISGETSKGEFSKWLHKVEL
jgi:thymidylate synthase